MSKFLLQNYNLLVLEKGTLMIDLGNRPYSKTWQKDLLM